MTYLVDITIGAPSAGLSWSFTGYEDGVYREVDDSVTVLAGLQFSWTVPDGLWPAQPEVTVAALALNVPQFSEAAIHYGQKLSVEVKADDAGEVVASFYGRITDWDVVSRDPERTGVTASLIAVDYTVDLAEEPATPFEEGDFPDFHEKTIASRLFEQFTGVDVDDMWTSGATRYIWPDSISLGQPVALAPFLAGLLAQAVNLTAGTRMILSPNVDATGDIAPAPSGRDFTLDTISNDVDADPDPWVLDAGAVPIAALRWRNAKGQIPKSIVGTGWGGDSANTVTALIDTAAGSTVVEIATNTNDEAEAQETVDFYAAVAGFDTWQVSQFTIEVSAAGIGPTVPVGLFPDWKADEGDPARAACYNRRIRVVTFDTTRTPYGSPVIDGVLVGATCRIDGGQLAFDIALRLPGGCTGVGVDDYIHPSDYGTAPTGGLGVA